MSPSKPSITSSEQEALHRLLNVHFLHEMCWYPKSEAHLMLQTRTRVLDGTPRTRFQSWNPGLFNAANINQAMERKAA